MFYMQGKRRVLATDEWLRVKGCEDVYAIGDCATIDQKKIMVCGSAEIFYSAVILCCCVNVLQHLY